MRKVNLSQKFLPSNHSTSWYVYIIRCANNSLYTGIASDIQRRFREHVDQKAKCAKYLRGKQPLKLVFQLCVENKSAALKIEAQIKRLTKTAKEDLIKTQTNN